MKTCLARFTAAFATAAAAFTVGSAFSQTEIRAKPDALLQIDMNRPAVVERIVTAWKKELPAAQIEGLKQKLMQLRADQLLAANVSGSFDGVLEILQQAQVAQPIQQRLETDAVKAKAIGDVTQDLVYTPITPCRIIDTRGAGAGILAGGTKRDFDIIASSFAGQGGSATNCNIDVGAVAIAVNLTSTQAPGGGNLRAYSSSLATAPTSSNVNYPGQSIQISEANFAIVPICTASCPGGLEMSVLASSPTHLVADVAGYFMPPTRAGNGLRITQTAIAGFPDAPNVANGSVSNVSNGLGSTVSGGGRTGLECSDTLLGNNSRNCANLAEGPFSTVGGGVANYAFFYGAVAGGVGNTANIGAAVPGGFGNVASGDYSSIAGGFQNVAAGAYSMIGGGQLNSASGGNSFAAGRRAKANYTGAFLWADSTNLDFKVQANEFVGLGSGWFDAANTFNARATGGVWFVTAVDATTGRPTAGAFLSAGSGTWSQTSDRNSKTAIKPINTSEILRKVAALPISSWQYITEAGVRHIGPMSQDFKRAFQVGPDDRSITTIDAGGVALAAIQGLNQKLESEMRLSKAKDGKISALEIKAERLEAVERELAAIKKKLGL